MNFRVNVPVTFREFAPVLLPLASVKNISRPELSVTFSELARMLTSRVSDGVQVEDMNTACNMNEHP